MGDDISDMDDAIIEDTVHCTLCGMPWVLGGNEDGVIIDPPKLSQGQQQLKLCIGCAASVHAEFERISREAGVCEHGVNDGDWCEPCNLEYQRARAVYEKGNPHGNEG